MSKKVLAFAASNSSVSINHQLVTYAASLLGDAQVETLNLHDFEMPIYQHDREEEGGIPRLAHDFLARIAAVDAVIVSFPEHNGLYSAAFKNLFDWCSRIGRDVWQNKPTVMLATSPGPGGAARVLNLAETAAPHFGGNVVASLAVPNFNQVFDSAVGKLTDAELDAQLKAAIAKLV